MFRNSIFILLVTPLVAAPLSTPVRAGEGEGKTAPRHDRFGRNGLLRGTAGLKHPGKEICLGGDKGRRKRLKARHSKRLHRRHDRRHVRRHKMADHRQLHKERHERHGGKQR